MKQTRIWKEILRKGNHFAVVSKRLNRLLKEHRRQGVLALLGELGFQGAEVPDPSAP